VVSTEPQAAETISIHNRMKLYQKLSAIKIEIEALMRLLGDNNKDMTWEQAEALSLRQLELMETVWNITEN